MNYQQIAKQIARDLFTNGQGQRAQRMILQARDGEDLGGWGEKPIAERIAMWLQKATGVSNNTVEAGPAVPPPSPWKDISEAPKDGRFLVYAAGCGYLMVMDGRMLAMSRWPHTPNHLSGSHWTHWVPLPALPDGLARRCADELDALVGLPSVLVHEETKDDTR